MNLERLKWSLKSEKKKQKVLKNACALLRLWPETNELLTLCEKQQVGIRLNEALFNTTTDGQLRHNRTTGASEIELKPYNNPQDLAVALIHELRHLWQAEQLGLLPGKAGLAEENAQVALLLTRVKEADAFAFTNLMISRINNGISDFKDSEKLEKQLRRQKPALPDQTIQDRADDLLAGRLAGRIEADQKKMGADFLKALTWLDSYDRETLSEYHRRYIRPDPVTGKPQQHLTPKDGRIVDLADIRRLLRTGTAANMPPYLEELDDKAFTAAVARDVDPALSGVVDLMTAFEKVAARPLPAEEILRQREMVNTKLQNALSAPPRLR